MEVRICGEKGIVQIDSPIHLLKVYVPLFSENKPTHLLDHTPIHPIEVTYRLDKKCDCQSTELCLSHRNSSAPQMRE